MLRTALHHIYFHSSTQKHLRPGLTNLRDCLATLEQMKAVYGSPENKYHVAMCPTREGRSYDHWSWVGRRAGARARGKPRLPQSCLACHQFGTSDACSC